MKRMVDGIIDGQITQGDYGSSNDTNASITFKFPYGYWPLSLISVPFSILPGHIDWGNDADISGICFPIGERYFESVSFNSGTLNLTQNGEQMPNSVTYYFTFANKANRDAFVKSLFGATATPTNGNTIVAEFSTPVYALLTRVGGANQEY